MDDERPDFESLKDFWKLIRPIHKNEYLEIRITDRDKPKRYYDAVGLFMESYPDMIIKNKTQFFIQKFEELTLLLSYDNYYFFKNFKICYGISLRNMKKGEIGGSYEYVENARFVFFDIDKSDHTNVWDYQKNALELFINDVILIQARKHHLTHCTQVFSGGGIHLLFKIPKTKLTEGKKLWYKKFVKELCDKVNLIHDFEIDGIYDFTRVFALPETMNVKRDVKTYVRNISYGCNDKFKFKIARKSTKKLAKNLKYNYPKIDNSLEWMILKKNAPKGERHQTLLFSIKLLAKELGMTHNDMKPYEAALTKIYGGSIILDPNYGTEGKTYSPGIIINWCKRNLDWCKANNIEFRGYAKHMRKDTNV